MEDDSTHTVSASAVYLWNSLLAHHYCCVPACHHAFPNNRSAIYRTGLAQRSIFEDYLLHLPHCARDNFFDAIDGSERTSIVQDRVVVVVNAPQIIARRVAKLYITSSLARNEAQTY